MKIDNIWETVFAVLLAIAGGFARILNLEDSKKLKLSLVFSELFISGFGGLIVLMIARHYGLSGDLIGAACGISGWSGPRLLDLIAKATEKRAGIEIDKKDE